MTAPTTERVPTERVRELREAATPGPWDAGAVNVYATAGCPRHCVGGCPTASIPCVCVIVVTSASDRDRLLIAAAPDLAADLLDARSERDALADALRTERAAREAADAHHAAIAGAVRAERTARILFDHADVDFDDDAIDSNEYNAALTTWSAAHDAVRDALAGAPCGYVEARVVRAYLAAVDEWDEGEPTDAWTAARHALDDALAAATTTATAGDGR